MKFNHFSNWDPERLTIGGVYETSWEISNYWTQKLASSDTATESDLLYLSTISLLESFSTDPIIRHKTALNLVKSKYQDEIRKEHLFEEIRSKEFPDRPSRKKCIFLMPIEVAPVDYMKKMGFSPHTRTILEIETLSERWLHYADFTMLNCNSMSNEQQKDLARKYWTATAKRDLETEILFEGQFKICKIIK